MLFEFDSSKFLAKESFAAWIEYMSGIYHWEVTQAKTIGQGFFRAKHRVFKIGKLVFVDFAVTPHTLTYQATAESAEFWSKYVLVVVPLKGTLVRSVGNATIELVPDNVYVINRSDDAAVSRIPRRYESIGVFFPREKFEDIFPLAGEVGEIQCSAKSLGGKMLIEVIRTMREYAENMKAEDALSVDVMTGLFAEALSAMLYSLPQLKSAPTSLLAAYHKNRIKSWVKDNLREILSVEIIATAIGLSPSYIMKLFSNDRLSLMRLVTEERLERCRQDLGSSLLLNRSIKEISYSWGFNDQTHFSHAFRDRFGESASDYREKQIAALGKSNTAEDSRPR